MTLEQIVEEGRKSASPVIKVIATAGNSKVMGLAIQAGSGLKEHHTKTPARLIVLEGEITYLAGVKRQSLTKYQQIDIPPLESHSVEAVIESLCILIHGHD